MISQADTSKPGRPPCSVFLCHNSADKPLVKEIADRLELDFGVPHFLDAFAIPSGEAFKPWIERALRRSSGCAIFLGSSGWGPTHLWEAELAAGRKRDDPTFRMIPVALPGLDETQILKLDHGRVFRELNWVDLRNGIIEQDGLDRLYAAVTGEPPSEGRGPAQLTPYQVRRDAARWKRSNPPDASILYRGSQLGEAERLTGTNPGLAGVEEIAAFLVASASRQRAVWRRLATAALLTAVVVFVLALWSEHQRRLAESRRVLAVSRQLALESQAERSPVPSLLVAAQAYKFAPSAEAAANLLQRLQAWPYLERMFHSGVGPLTTLAWHDGRGSIIAGTANGGLVEWLVGPHAPGIPFTRASTGEVRCVSIDQVGNVWAGYEDGRIIVWDASGRRTPIEGIPQGVDTRQMSKINTLQVGPPIQAIALSWDGEMAAVGTAEGAADGLVLLVNMKTKSVIAGPITVGVPRVNSLDFDRRSELIVAGTGFGPIILIDRIGRAVRRIDEPSMGEIIAVRFTDTGDLIAVDDVGRVAIWDRSRSFARSGMFRTRDSLTAAAIRADGRKIVLGDSTGTFHIVDVNRQEVETSLKALGGMVRGVAWDRTGDRVLTAGADGTGGLWNLSQMSPVVATAAKVPIRAYMLTPQVDGSVLMGVASVGAAGVWRLAGDRAKPERDLLELTRSAVGLAAFDTARPPTQGDGFVPVQTPEIEHTRIDLKGERAVWVTRDGAVLWTSLKEHRPAIVLTHRSLRGSVQALAFSDGGTFVAVAYDDPSVLLYKLPTGEPVRIAIAAPARSLAFSQRGTMLAVGLETGGVELRTVPGGGEVDTVPKLHTSATGNVTFARNDTLLVSHAVVGNGTEVAITVVPIPALQPSRAFIARPSGTPPAVVAASGDFIAGVNGDGTIDLWHALNYSALGSLKISDLPLTAAAFSRDQRHLWIADDDGWIRSISVHGDSWLAIACRLAGRPLTKAEWSQYLSEDEYQPACSTASAYSSVAPAR